MTSPRHSLTLAIVLFAQSAAADTLTFQQGDGGAYSTTDATTITVEGAPVGAATSGVLTIVTYDVQALLRFPDIIGSNPGQIPAGSTINSASLSVTMYIAAIWNSTTNIHKINVPWDENTVGGNTFYAQPAPQYGPLFGQMVGVDRGDPTSADVTAVVQDWADGDPNYGVMFRLETPATPEEGFTHCQYYSEDATTLSVRPKLTVEFTPPNVAVESSTWGRVKALYR